MRWYWEKRKWYAMKCQHCQRPSELMFFDGPYFHGKEGVVQCPNCKCLSDVRDLQSLAWAGLGEFRELSGRELAEARHRTYVQELTNELSEATGGDVAIRNQS